MVGGVPVLIFEYVVLGASPFGPIWPGAGLFAIPIEGTGEVADSDFTGSAVPEPIAAAIFPHALIPIRIIY